jgi:hypothetical protein
MRGAGGQPSGTALPWLRRPHSPRRLPPPPHLQAERLRALSVASSRLVEELRTKLARGEVVLKLAELCRKYETEAEQVLPFFTAAEQQQAQVGGCRPGGTWPCLMPGWPLGLVVAAVGRAVSRALRRPLLGSRARCRRWWRPGPSPAAGQARCCRRCTAALWTTQGARWRRTSTCPGGLGWWLGCVRFEPRLHVAGSLQLQLARPAACTAERLPGGSGLDPADESASRPAPAPPTPQVLRTLQPRAAGPGRHQPRAPAAAAAQRAAAQQVRRAGVRALLLTAPAADSRMPATPLAATTPGFSAPCAAALCRHSAPPAGCSSTWRAFQ